MAKHKNYPDGTILQIHRYWFDKWIDVGHKDFEKLEKEAKDCGGELKNSYLIPSDFEHDTYYYYDECGHTYLFRVVTSWSKEHLIKEKEETTCDTNKDGKT